MATGPAGKVRSPLVVIIFSIITLSIYSLYWQYATFKEMKAYSGSGIGGGLGLLFAFLIGVVNIFVMPAEVGSIYAAEGKDKPVSGVTGFWVLIPIIGGIIWVVKTQGALNRQWGALGAAA